MIDIQCSPLEDDSLSLNAQYVFCCLVLNDGITDYRILVTKVLMNSSQTVKKPALIFSSISFHITMVPAKYTHISAKEICSRFMMKQRCLTVMHLFHRIR